MFDDHLILAGGGHTHVLLLLRWSISPKLKPKGLITLVSRKSSTLYSGMIPGLIAGKYKKKDCLINLDFLAYKAGISFVRAEIIGIDIVERYLHLESQPSLYYNRLSLDVGSETYLSKFDEELIENSKGSVVSIRPLEKTINWINHLDKIYYKNSGTVTIIGSGFTAIEIAFALKYRWPKSKIQIQVDRKKVNQSIKRKINLFGIKIIQRDEKVKGNCLFCTGNKAPSWLANSKLPVDPSGRVLTLNTFQVIDNLNIFAVGDCGVIESNFTPPSGVWAVKAAKPLARNLERISNGLGPINWKPQPLALQLIGINFASSEFKAWACLGGFVIGPYSFLGTLKEFLDKRFISMFNNLKKMKLSSSGSQEMPPCRGCAAKLPSQQLTNALRKANLTDLAINPEDASIIASLPNSYSYIQSVDGFPAIVSDPWLNGRLTTLHACSDIWASGGSVLSAQAIISLPEVSGLIQEEFLRQSLLGIKSVLDPQGAKLIGGHSMESRDLNTQKLALGIQISLSVNGLLASEKQWPINGLQSGDLLLISRGIGSGVIFSAAMAGEVHPDEIDELLLTLSKSQHIFLDDLINVEQRVVNPFSINACTDITGFGLLGHLVEMLNSTNYVREMLNLSPLRIELNADLIPTLKGSMHLINKGFSSSLAPFNRQSLSSLEPSNNNPASIEIIYDANKLNSKRYQNILELIIDPQTCGPLLLSCSKETAEALIKKLPWKVIGEVI